MKQRVFATLSAVTPGNEYRVDVTIRATSFAAAACFDFHRIHRAIQGFIPEQDDAAHIAYEIALHPSVVTVHVRENDQGDLAHGVLVHNLE